MITKMINKGNMKKVIASIGVGAVILVEGGMIYTLSNELDLLDSKYEILTEKYNSLEREKNELKKENDKNKKDLKYYKSDEYIQSIKLSKMSNATGLDVKDYYTENFKFTYYTALSSENGGYTITCNGETLSNGMVASNYYPQGTKLFIDGRTYTVADRGSSRFNSPNRLDVFVPRQGGESSGSYYNRVNNMGVKNTEGYVLTLE